MGIKILTVGKLKETYLREAEKEYIKRLRPYDKVQVIEIKESSKEDIIEEGQRILDKISDKAFVITLEIEGKALTSEEFSFYIEKWQMEMGEKVFVIGGSKGLSPKVIERSNFSISMSNMTFTHQMVRIFLLEQIYRAFKIMRGENYHK